MELNLQPRAASCFVSGEPFREGDRVASLLVRPDAGGVVRYDALEANSASLAPVGFVACRWVHAFKPQQTEENRDKTLKLTAETLFLTLADPSTELTPENDRLVRFLALLLERKRILRPRGKTPDGARELYEHSRSKQTFEVPAIDLDADFFSAVREQLSVLVGEPAEPAAVPPPAEPAAAS
jgi:hypothetical protein